MAAARENFQELIANLEMEATRALTAGRAEEAARIGLQIQQADPNNQRAATFVNGGGDLAVRLRGGRREDPVPEGPAGLGSAGRDIHNESTLDLATRNHGAAGILRMHAADRLGCLGLPGGRLGAPRSHRRSHEGAQSRLRNRRRLHRDSAIGLGGR